MIDVAESGIFREGTTGGCQWRVRGLIQSETLRRTSHPHWVSPDCRWRWPVEHPHQLVGLRWTCRCRTLQCITNSSSVRKKFPTSVCRHSTSSTGKTLQHLWLDLNKLLGAAGVDVEAADAASALADAVGEAAGAVVAVVAAAIAGDVAAGSRRVPCSIALERNRPPNSGGLFLTSNPSLSKKVSDASQRPKLGRVGSSVHRYC